MDLYVLLKMPETNQDSSSRSPGKPFWVLAYLSSPGLAFLCLRAAGVIGVLECFLGTLAGLLAHLGLVSVLVGTNEDPLQGFVLLGIGFSIYLVVMWQFVAGQRVSFWSEVALRQWRIAGRFFGGLLGFSLLAQIILFHLERLLR